MYKLLNCYKIHVTAIIVVCVLVFLVVLNSANISTVRQIPVTGINNDCIKVEMITLDKSRLYPD